MANWRRWAGVTSTLAPLSQAHQGAGHQGAGGAGGHHPGDVVLVPEQDDGLHHRAVPLEAHHVGGLFVAADDFGRVDDLEAGGVIGLPLQLFPEDGLVPGEDEVQVRILRKGGEGACDGRLGRMVAAETVDKEFDHTSFFT